MKIILSCYQMNSYDLNKFMNEREQLATKYLANLSNLKICLNVYIYISLLFDAILNTLHQFNFVKFLKQLIFVIFPIYIYLHDMRMNIF